MSRIGNRIIEIPEGIDTKIENQIITVKGPRGELSMTFDKNIDVVIQDSEITVTRNSNIKRTKQMHGTTNSLINNMIEGVKNGYEKTLEIVGVGYRFNNKGKVLAVSAGYSHIIELPIPEGITLESISNTEIKILGIDKEAVGEFAAQVRRIRKPEPYKGKGVRYKDEVVRRKDGKKASK